MKKLILSMANFWLLPHECTSCEKIIYIILKLWMIILIITFIAGLAKIIVELLTDPYQFSNEKFELIAYMSR
jgi:hypothetical protein